MNSSKERRKEGNESGQMADLADSTHATVFQRRRLTLLLLPAFLLSSEALFAAPIKAGFRRAGHYSGCRDGDAGELWEGVRTLGA